MDELILLVEDDETLGATLRDFFNANGLNVTWAKDGESAIHLFKETPFNLIILDVVLPGIDGFKVAAHVRKVNSMVPILFMTGTALDVHYYNKAFGELGAINYIEKPFLPARALAQIKSVLHPVGTVNYTTNQYQIRIIGQELTINNQNYTLLQKEAQLFSILLMKVNTTVEREHLLHAIWRDNQNRMNNALERTVLSLRKVLKGFQGIEINTIYGTGYRLSIPSTS